MKKIFIFLLIILSIIPAMANDPELKKIECNMYCKTTKGNLYKEDYTTAVFQIDDTYKQIYLYTNGSSRLIVGTQNIFNSDEISYNNLKMPDKQTGELNINRQSGSIYIKIIKPDIWLGDMVSEYQGTCEKLQGNKF